MDPEGQRHAFIQVLNGKTGEARYHRFAFEEFRYDPGRFHVRIGNNEFFRHGLRLDLEDMRGELHFQDTVSWPKRFMSPGVMGPFSFAPFMECYHGVVSMDHIIQGELTAGGEKVIMDEGRGYTEKDWGSSFPRGYLWLHSNHFEDEHASMMMSIAEIPWLGMKFIGFLCGLWLNGKLIRFTTYNGSRLAECSIDDNEFRVVMRQHRYELTVTGPRTNHASKLASPVQGDMNSHIEETMTSSIRVELRDRRSCRVILDDHARHTALEIAGDTDLISKNKK